MVFTVGPEPHVFKAKDGQLTVVRPHQGTGSIVLVFFLMPNPYGKRS